MEKRNWPVTFSIGALTFLDTPNSSAEVIKLADDLMYSAKSQGKNATIFSVYQS
jgi:GGDEF domain-containing protein